VDGAGSLGMKYSPFFCSTIAGEPASFTALETKNMFCQIHGWGTMIFQSYPVLEKQGSNLVIEVSLRCLLYFLKETNKKSVRNVYFFYDNTAVNKCFNIIAAFSCVVLLGNK
jgi:hypothetical protein